MSAILAIVGSILAIIIGLWQRCRYVAEIKRKQAEMARRDLDEANQNDDPGKLLDAFDRLR